MTEVGARTIGDKTLLTVSDGNLHIGPDRLFRNIPAAQSAPLLQPVDDEGNALIPMRSLVIRSGGRLILIDTGLGLHSPIRREDGTLLAELAAAGIRPAEINDVVISHAHGDHIGWSTVEDEHGRHTTFPNARYWISGPEFRHWMQPAHLESNASLRAHLPALEGSGQLELPEDEAEIAPGVRLLATPGHTPGHRSVLVTGGTQVALFTGDLSHHPLHYEFPNWGSVFDSDPDQAYRTRVRMLNQATADHLLLISYHHPTPYGQAINHGASFRWEPVD